MELDAKHLYYLACLDTYRDGKEEPAESATLARLKAALGIEDAQATSIAGDAKAAFGGGTYSDAPLEPKTLYQTACRIALLDDHVSYGEASLLTDLAEALEIPFDQATLMLEELQPDLPELDPVTVGEAPEDVDGILAEEGREA